ncbi:MAG TPA: transketolase C-terminal domain-containing protein [Gammaproteobacteria bacterium]|nr:transketolase C-terminal domain-containing protein [Gammaproteobacteria bacterium]
MTQHMRYAAAINEALYIAMERDPKVLCFGLGVDDPKHIFGTTVGLQEQFGEQRVFDMPTSENAITGMGIGVSLTGYRPVMTHQRLDFFLLAMDQLVNAAAKWYYMFGGQVSVPIVIRLIIGRGWGQGPTHSQNLQAWFAHIPGLKVVMPASPADAKGLLLESIFDDNPVLFLEHRWLHNSEGEVPIGDYRVSIGKARIAREGKEVTLVSMSYMTIEALRAASYLEKQGISCEIVDLRTIKPIDWETIFTSIQKTKRLMVLDTGVTTGSVAGEIIARVCMDHFSMLAQAPVRIALPDNPEPTSFGLTKYYYPCSENIIRSIANMLSIDVDLSEATKKCQSFHDIPGDWFKGPF